MNIVMFLLQFASSYYIAWKSIIFFKCHGITNSQTYIKEENNNIKDVLVAVTYCHY